MKKFNVFLYFVLSLIVVNQLNAQETNNYGLEVRFQPDSTIYVYENVGPEMSKQFYTAIIQNMAFVNLSNSPVIIDKACVDVISRGSILQKQYVSKREIISSVAKFKMLQDYGVLELYDFQFQTSKYLKDLKLSRNDTLKAGEAAIVAHETLLFDELPDSLRVSFIGKTINNKEIKISRALRVVNHKSKNKYILPLKGSWIAAAAPSIIGHHRWGSIQEFAFDFIKIGEGQLSYRNRGESLGDYYAYGEPVYAIDDGVVVAVLDGISESSNNLKRPNEDEEDYLTRMKSYQEGLMKKGLKYVFGNHIVIKHENNEYSSYFHLKNKSIKVKLGDVLKQGQQIGQLGHSGNSTEPHLHFHISDSPDIAYSRSIPVEFINITLFPADDGNVRHIHSGQILKTKN